jgi:transcriptional regulator with PAS, ATPase and Fis domain
MKLVAATNRNLRSMVAAGTFREDLFHRLNAVSVVTPPLRECCEGIGSLVAHFVNLHSREAGKRITHISGRALRMLFGYNWPGNVREMSNAMQSAVFLMDNSRIDVENLPPHLVADEGPVDHERELEGPDTRATTQLEESLEEDGLRSAIELDSMTRSALLRSLERTRGNRQQAAKLLGISRQKLYRMIARYELSQAGRQSQS